MIWLFSSLKTKAKRRRRKKQGKQKIQYTVYKNKHIYQSPISWHKKASPHPFYSWVTLYFFTSVFHAKCTLPVWLTPFTWWLRCRSTLSFLLLWGRLLLGTIKRKQSANKRQNKMHCKSVKYNKLFFTPCWMAALFCSSVHLNTIHLLIYICVLVMI